MERNPVKRKVLSQEGESSGRAVAAVTDYRMPGQFRMAPDLMLAAGERFDFHHRVMGAVVNDPVRGFARLPGSGAFRVEASAGGFGKTPSPCPPRGVSFQAFQAAMQKSDIAFFYLAGFELFRKETKQIAGGGQNDNAACFFVETINRIDAEIRIGIYLTPVGKLFLNNGTKITPGLVMHRHPGRFVHRQPTFSKDQHGDPY